MGLRTTLEQLYEDLRKEVFDSVGAAHGAASYEHYTYRLQRAQKYLYDMHDWRHLMVDRDVQLQKGLRYYDLPGDLNIDRIKAIRLKFGSSWLKLSKGIRQTHYTIHDSDSDERSDPVRRWDYYMPGTNPQIEIWPVPSADGTASTLENYIRLSGIRALSPLVGPSDRADLDNMLIVLSAAGDILAKRNSNDAQLFLQRAQQRMRMIKMNEANDDTPIAMGKHGEAVSGVHSYGDNESHIYDDYGRPHLVRNLD